MAIATFAASRIVRYRIGSPCLTERNLASLNRPSSVKNGSFRTTASASWSVTTSPNRADSSWSSARWMSRSSIWRFTVGRNSGGMSVFVRVRYSLSAWSVSRVSSAFGMLRLPTIAAEFAGDGAPARGAGAPTAERPAATASGSRSATTSAARAAGSSLMTGALARRA